MLDTVVAVCTRLPQWETATICDGDGVAEDETLTPMDSLGVGDAVTEGVSDVVTLGVLDAEVLYEGDTEYVTFGMDEGEYVALGVPE